MASAGPVHSHQGRPEIDPELHDVAHLIHREYDEKLGTRAVDECLAQVAARFEGATVRPFVPLLVGRYVREELRARLAPPDQDQGGNLNDEETVSQMI